MNRQQKHIELDTYAKIVLSYFLILYFYRIYSGSILTSIFNQPLIDVANDYTYWLINLTQLPSYIISNYWSCILIDVIVLLLCIVCIFTKKQRFVFASILLFLFFIQRITLGTFSNTHTKSISCVMVAILPFCFKKESNSTLMIEFGRYFLIYILVISAYHKFVNGALVPHNFVNVLINQHVDLTTLNPSHISYRVATYIIQHPTLADILFYTLFITQLSFIIGVFTKKMDKILFLMLLCFAVFTYYIMRIYNFDITILGLSLLYFKNSKK